MFNKTRSFRPNKKYSNGTFTRPQRSGYGSPGGFRRSRYGNPHRSDFGRDTSVFVKKAAPISGEVQVESSEISFADFRIANILKTNIISKGYVKPTPIQSRAIQPIMEGRDLIGLANTGTGKTAAFLIPIIDQIFKDRQKKALIIAPTRELAVQITEELRSFTEGMRIYSALIIGGTNTQRQIYNLRRNPHVVIGTPGRMKDLMQQGALRLDDFSIFVLDEVDLMVDIGFIDDVRYFVSYLPKERQSLFFSATISPKIEGILQDFVRDPITVSVKMQDTSENVDQDVIRVISRDKKIDQLHDVLIQDGFDKVLVFGRTKHSVDHLHRELTTRGFRIGAIHGNKSQGARRRVLDSFKRNEIQVLLATDVASRGLDIPDVTHVINYEIPDSYDDYVHRIGRTGRADKKGVALTFVD